MTMTTGFGLGRTAARRDWDRLGRAEVRALQDRSLRRYLQRTVLPFSPYYRELFAELGIDPATVRGVDDLRRLPFTSKRDLLATPEHPQRGRDFILQPDPAALARRPGVILSGLLRGRQRTRAALGREFRPVFLTSTTGRSAEPTPFLYTHHDLDLLAETAGRIMDLGSAGPEDRLLNCFPYAPHLAYWLAHFAGLSRGGFALGTGGGKAMGTEGNIRLIAKIKPTVLIAMPTFAYHLLSLALEAGERFEGIRLIVLGGEKVAEGTRTKLAELCDALGSPGVRIMATYGFTEMKTAYAGHPTLPGEEAPGYTVYPDLGIVEIVDPETGEPVPEGTGGEIVFTPLDARGTVVLRYRTGDLIDGGLTYEPCPYSGRLAPRLVGRIFRTASRERMQLDKLKGTLVDLNELEHVLDDIPGLATWQIELRKLDDDPLEVDRIIVHASTAHTGGRAGGDGEEALAQLVSDRFQAVTEVRPNEVLFHDAAEMRRRQEVGVAIKERKILDNRPAAGGGPGADAELAGGGDGKGIGRVNTEDPETAALAGAPAGAGDGGDGR